MLWPFISCILTFSKVILGYSHSRVHLLIFPKLSKMKIIGEEKCPPPPPPGFNNLKKLFWEEEIFEIVLRCTSHDLNNKHYIYQCQVHTSVPLSLYKYFYVFRYQNTDTCAMETQYCMSGSLSPRPKTLFSGMTRLLKILPMFHFLPRHGNPLYYTTVLILKGLIELVSIILWQVWRKALHDSASYKPHKVIYKFL